jgi:hypothetical protein
MLDLRTERSICGPYATCYGKVRASWERIMVRISAYVRDTHNLDGGVVLDVRHGRMFALNFVGSRIVELLKSHFQDSQIANEISQEFGIRPEIAAADVQEFLELLDKQHLIERRETDVTFF